GDVQQPNLLVTVELICLCADLNTVNLELPMAAVFDHDAQITREIVRIELKLQTYRQCLKLFFMGQHRPRLDALAAVEPRSVPQPAPCLPDWHSADPASLARFTAGGGFDHIPV